MFTHHSPAVKQRDDCIDLVLVRHNILQTYHPFGPSHKSNANAEAVHIAMQEIKANNAFPPELVLHGMVLTLPVHDTTSSLDSLPLAGHPASPA